MRSSCQHATQLLDLVARHAMAARAHLADTAEQGGQAVSLIFFCIDAIRAEVEIAENPTVLFRTDLLQRRRLLTVQHSKVEPARITAFFRLQSTHAILGRTAELLCHLVAAEERI